MKLTENHILRIKQILPMEFKSFLMLASGEEGMSICGDTKFDFLYEAIACLIQNLIDSFRKQYSIHGPVEEKALFKMGLVGILTPIIQKKLCPDTEIEKIAAIVYGLLSFIEADELSGKIQENKVFSSFNPELFQYFSGKN